MNRSQVVIAGGGPVGLICAYALARRGVTVTVLDQNSELQDDPRAATTHPATLDFGAWYGSVGIAFLALIAATAIFGFRVSSPAWLRAAERSG